MEGGPISRRSKRTKIDKDVVETLLDAGKTHAEIAEQLEVLITHFHRPGLILPIGAAGLQSLNEDCISVHPRPWLAYAAQGWSPVGEGR